MSAVPCPARPWEAAWAVWTWPEGISGRDNSRPPVGPLTPPTIPCSGKVSSPLPPDRQRNRRNSGSTRRTGERPGRIITTTWAARRDRHPETHRRSKTNRGKHRPPRTRRRRLTWRNWNRAPLLPAWRRRMSGRQRRSAGPQAERFASMTARKDRTPPAGPTGISTGTPSTSTAGAQIRWRRSSPTS